MKNLRAILTCLLVLILILPSLAQVKDSNKSASVIIEQFLAEFGIDAAVKKYRELRSDLANKFVFNESEFDSLGYRLLRSDKIKEAIEVFKMNVEMFPESWNVYDSLGEAYMWIDDRDNARTNLEKSVELNSENEHAVMRLNQLEGYVFDEQNETREPNKYSPEENTGLQGPYLGQTPPGLEPQVFAPGIISTHGKFEFSCTFSPDGKEFYFNRGPQIWVCRWEKAGWTAPERAPFNTNHLNHEAHITHDGQRMYFGSSRPRPDLKEGESSYAIYMMERTGDSWGEPKVHGQGMYVTTARNGNYYVTDTSQQPDGGILVRARYTDGEYSELEQMQGGVNSPYNDWHPCIAPDESYIVFDSSRPGGQGGEGDFYVCFRKKDGTWGEAINLGDNINTPGGNMCAYITPDGKYLFYHATNDIYWVSTKIIEQLRTKKMFQSK